MKLFEKILDERNIFNSIFCMESYVFDKGLLDTSKPVYLHNEGKVEETIAANDLELYYALADKHNIDLISKVIKCCHQKLGMKKIMRNKSRQLLNTHPIKFNKP